MNQDTCLEGGVPISCSCRADWRSFKSWIWRWKFGHSKEIPKCGFVFCFFGPSHLPSQCSKKNGNRQCTKNEQNPKTLVWQTLHISKLPLALLRSKVVCNSLRTTSSLRKDFQDLWAHNFTTTYFPKAKTPAVVMSNNDHLQLRLFGRKIVN